MKKSIQNSPKKQASLLGKAFHIVPRQIFQWFFSMVIEQKERAIVLLALICYSYHADGYRFYKGSRLKCKRGEYIGNYTLLADITGLSRYAAKKAVEELIEQALISMEKVNKGIRIRFDAYLEFLDQYSSREKRIKNQPAAPANPLQGLTLPSDKQLGIVDQLNNYDYEQE